MLGKGGLRTIDYIQLHLGESSIYSPVHSAPHPILESLWQGDVDDNGKPLNLVVPLAKIGRDPFLDWIHATRAAELRVQVYVNGSNMLQREGETPNPSAIPNITQRWKEWCDSTPKVQKFLDSEPYHRDPKFPERAYMFCYAEFILKDYAIRYGELIDAWLFDSGKFMPMNGDKDRSEKVKEQRLYQAFAEAIQAGNPNAAVSFNNGVGNGKHPLVPPTRFCDYTFGHPFGGLNSMTGTPSLYERNFGIVQRMADTNGCVFINSSRDWDDRVVGHFDPGMSTTAWNNGLKSSLTEEQFLEWNTVALKGG